MYVGPKHSSFLFSLPNIFLQNLFPAAPSIKPVHSWSMLSVKDSRLGGGLPPPNKKLSDSSTIFHAAHSASTQEIPGNPDLITHGEMTVVSGGLAFGGQESYAVSQLAPDDCVVNPEMCVDGMSFGTKLKFNQLSDDAQPHYIVDTGAHDKRMRGFSLFTERGKLVSIVKSADREWKVSETRYCGVESTESRKNILYTDVSEGLYTDCDDRCCCHFSL